MGERSTLNSNNFAKQMTNATKANLEEQIRELSKGKTYLRENTSIENFNTTFESEGTSTDNSSDIYETCGTRVGIFFMRDGNKEFYILNNELSTENFKFTELENIFLNLIGQLTHKVNLFDTIPTRPRRYQHMLTAEDTYKFDTSDLHQIEEWKVMNWKQIKEVVRGLKKKNVLHLEWIDHPVFIGKKELLGLHFTPEFIQERAAFDTKADRTAWIAKDKKMTELLTQWTAIEKN